MSPCRVGRLTASRREACVMLPRVLTSASTRAPRSARSRDSRRDDAGVDTKHLAAADALELARLQKPKELDLEGRTHLTDLVEEEGAAVRELELALSLHVRAGVGAALVAEQLGLQQGVGDRAAVDRDERPVVSRAVRVDGARQELLARSAL